MNSKFDIQLTNGIVNCEQYGDGSNLLIAFHGFANKGIIFEPLFEAIGNSYTLVSPDLPFHGATKWHKNYFDKQDVFELIDKILAQFSTSKFSICGYSMGGKITLICLDKYFDSIEKIMLIGADGTARNTPTSYMPSWFINILQNIDLSHHFFKISKFLSDKKIIPQYVSNFIELHILSPKRRDRVYKIWRTLNYFRTDYKKSNQIIEQNKIETLAFYGTKDEIITFKKFSEVFKNNPYVTRLQVFSNHWRLVEKTAEFISKNNIKF